MCKEDWPKWLDSQDQQYHQGLFFWPWIGIQNFVRKLSYMWCSRVGDFSRNWKMEFFKSWFFFENGFFQKKDFSKMDLKKNNNNFENSRHSYKSDHTAIFPKLSTFQFQVLWHWSCSLMLNSSALTVCEKWCVGQKYHLPCEAISNGIRDSLRSIS